MVDRLLLQVQARAQVLPSTVACVEQHRTSVDQMVESDRQKGKEKGVEKKPK